MKVNLKKSVKKYTNLLPLLYKTKNKLNFWRGRFKKKRSAQPYTIFILENFKNYIKLLKTNYVIMVSFNTYIYIKNRSKELKFYTYFAQYSIIPSLELLIAWSISGYS